MSDLAATNCGCGCGCECNNGGSGCNFIWLILILCCCGGGGFGGGRGCGGGSNCGCGCGGSNGCDFIWIILLLLIHAEKTFPRNIKTAVRIFRAAVFWCNRAISCYTKIPPGRLCAPGRRRYITASDSSPAPARPADFLHFPRGRDFCPVFSLRTRRQFHILHCHL